MSLRALRAPGWLAALALAGCGRCSPPPPDARDAAPAPMQAPSLLPPARPWTFREVRGRPLVAAPIGCAPRAPTMQAAVPPTTGFVAERGSPATLLVADAVDDGARLAGASAMRFDESGALAEQRPLPWIAPATVPRLGRTEGGGWIATIAEQAEAGAWRAGLWRDGAVELIGEGDRFEAVDLRCARGRCALLTPRLGAVALPGAEVWLGAADAPLAAWRRVVIEGTEAESDAHPLVIAGLEGLGAQGALTPGARPGAPDVIDGLAAPDAGRTDTGPIGAGQADAGSAPAPAPGGAAPAPGGAPLVALVEKGDCAFFRVGGAAAQPAGRVQAPHGVLDALAVPGPLAMVHGTPIDDRGCVPPEAGGAEAVVRFARPGAAPPAELRTPAPPLRGALRRLTRGALATWLAPLGCGAARRVVYAVRLDEAGAPAAGAIPVADADRYAVASDGDDVDLWLQQGESVTWMRLRCGAH